MEYFAGLDVSMDETHICVVDRDGSMILETRATTSPRQSRRGWRRQQGVSGSYSRRAAWRRCCITVSMRWGCR